MTTIETITVAEPVEYVDRSLPTACNWIKYAIQPGTYEVNYHFSYRKVRVEAIRVEEHFINRLFTASALADQSAAVGQREIVSVPAWVVEG